MILRRTLAAVEVGAIGFVNGFDVSTGVAIVSGFYVLLKTIHLIKNWKEKK